MIVVSFIAGILVGVVGCIVAAQIIANRNMPPLAAPPESTPNISELTCAISDRAAHVVSLLNNGPMTSNKRAAVEEEARGLAQAATNLHYWAKRGTKPLGELLERTETE